MPAIDVSAGSYRFRWKRWLIGFVLFVVAGLAAAGWFVYRAISAALHAENGLHATRFTIAAVEDYVRKHDGTWPRSWNDLEQSSPQMRDVYRFTDGPDKVEEFVSVDFNADPDLLAKQNADEFYAIKPVRPSFENYRSHLPFLLDALRQTRRSRSNANDKPTGGK